MMLYVIRCRYFSILQQSSMFILLTEFRSFIAPLQLFAPSFQTHKCRKLVQKLKATKNIAKFWPNSSAYEGISSAKMKRDGNKNKIRYQQDVFKTTA